MDSPVVAVKDNKLLKGAFAVDGIMVTLVIYGVLEEKLMRVPYGQNKEFFTFSLFLVFCNRLTTSAVSAASLVASKKALDPVAPVYKYCLVSVTNILTTTCQYEALEYVSFPVQTLAKCAKMIPVMIWGSIIMQKRYKGLDYLWAVLVTVGCSVFILYPAGDDISPYKKGRESTVWGMSLMAGYLGFDGFTSTFQDKLFKGYNMEIHNQIFYTTLCSCVLSLTGRYFMHSHFVYWCYSDVWGWIFLLSLHMMHAMLLVRLTCVEITETKIFNTFDVFALGWIDFINTITYGMWTFAHILMNLLFCLAGLVLQGQLLAAIDFIHRHNDCLYDIVLLSIVATASQFFISYTIRTFGALTFATIMTTRQLISILLSCLWFAHPLSPLQWLGAVIVFGSLYAKSFLRDNTQKSPPPTDEQDKELAPLKGNP